MTRKRQETRTIQLWPGGESFEYRGDPDGPDNQKSLRKGYASRDETNPWRKGTADEWRKIRINLRAEMYGRRDVLGCDSSLVDDLIKAASSGIDVRDLAEGFSYDEIRNIYKDPSDWTLEQCRDYVREHGDEDRVEPNPWTMDRDALIEALDISPSPVINVETLRRELITKIDDETIAGLEDWREAARELAQENPQEPYEWWRVSSWLCDQLHAIGEVTIDNGYGHWWGRTCTGQGWIMDGTLQEIAARFES